MPDYVVFVPSLWFTSYLVKAKNEKDAIEQVRSGNAESSNSAEYDRQLEPEEWPWQVEYQEKHR